MKISIIGTGYVGLVTGVCFTEMGNEVWCVDKNKDKVEKLNNFVIPIYEPGLDVLIEANCNKGRLKFTTGIKHAIEITEFCFISVGTPSGEDGGADLKQVLDAAVAIGDYMIHHMYVVCKSTVPVGTTEKVRETIQNRLHLRNSELTFDIISNPEFLREGSAINDCMRPTRIVIGFESENALAKMRELYLPFIRNTENFIPMDIKSAEMTKYVANAMLATKISFMNEMANICEKVGANINDIRLGIGSDPRIGYEFIYAGIGYGGSCFPKDVKALIATGVQNDCTPKILKAVEIVNEKQKLKIPEKLVEKYGPKLQGKTFAIWGLSFKPDTDDMRFASSIVIIDDITNRGGKIKAYDPKCMDLAKSEYLKGNGSVEYVDDKYKALENSDALILITEWKEFRSPDFYKIKELLKESVIFDGRNQYNSATLNSLDFEYHQIGVRTELNGSSV